MAVFDSLYPEDSKLMKKLQAKNTEPGEMLTEAMSQAETQAMIKENFDKLSPDEQERATNLLLKALPEKGIALPPDINIEFINFKSKE